ncbi:MAG: hypothetical protein M0R74_07150 [Dehalococcoidia bacterium]|nr:hypothetical protein [Dehalococcoidia bacterium]
MSGRLLGHVAEVGADAFAVDAANGRLWLYNKVLFTADNGRVTLICEPDGLPNYQLDQSG